MIMKGNEDDMNRFLFYALLERGVRYLRIVSKYIRFGKPAREVAEFIQRPGEGRYTRLVRKTVDIEVITQQNTRTIQVEEGSATKARRFSVRKEMKLEASIGVVRYCCYVVNAKVHGLIERKVIWEGGHDAPVITVISLYSEGYCLTTKHVFKGIGRGFRMENRVWTPIFLSPKDEGMYNEHAEAPQSCPVSRATENEDQEPCTSESVIKFSGRPVPEVIADSTTQEGASVQEFNPPVPDLTVPAQIHPGDVESVQLAISSSSYDESDWDSSD
ncbi:hypothetical protein BEWA_041580 [Theileria equi strain WA]|uniref:Uncharacterized protein n=1 Tax=Theileria equi strain WA TaxID=1537102 RepID=L1LFS8_THEEQ|nr:hypothetical protein BEWA_041580 [Theileria equi strain WA]EKX74120.1 hypothetical protein BEWA_041580 [Theileria equi strain WA]|eukprot:XP_004833572.1 hypothetical protein BEWA_041580 [Theileria equi strain WA]